LKAFEEAMAEMAREEALLFGIKPYIYLDEIYEVFIPYRNFWT